MPSLASSASPASDWTTATSPKTAAATASAGNLIVVLGGTEDSSTTLGVPSDGSNAYTLLTSSAIASNCAGYAWTTGIVGQLAITTASLPGGTVGTAYNATLTATGGTGTGYTWSAAGALPAGLSLNAGTGLISGTPATTGTSGFTITVKDSASNTASAAFSIVITTVSSLAPTGPTGTWTLAWNDEFNDGAGMSGHTNGLSQSKWNVGNYFGPSSPGGPGYQGKSKTASNGAGAIEFYGPGSLSFPSGGGMNMSNYAPGGGPDGSYSISGFSSNSEGAGVNTSGIMNITCNTGYSVPSGIASTVIQAASITVEAKIKWAGPCTDGSYWDWFGTYNSGDCSTPGYPNSGTWTEEMDWWEELGSTSQGNSFAIHMHPTLTYNGPTSTPSSLQNTDLSQAFHIYTVQMTYSTIALWVDGIAVGGISPTTAMMQAQWATPQYIGIMHQLRSGYTLVTGSGGVTPLQVAYVRVFTQ